MTTQYEVLHVSLPPALISYVKRAAAESDRTVSGQVRHLLLDSARRLGVDLANGTTPPAPRPLLEPTPAAIAEARIRLVGLQEEAARLRAIVSNPAASWTVREEARYREVQEEANRLDWEIQRAEKLIAGAAGA
jgi:hypothetical protein